MAALNDTIRKIIDGKNFATVATVGADGSPNTSVVWITRDGDDLLFSTVKGRLKERNLRRDPRISISVFDQDDPLSYFEARGQATISEENGFQLIDDLSLKYRGEHYTGDQGTDNVRVIVRLTPAKLTGYAV